MGKIRFLYLLTLISFQTNKYLKEKAGDSTVLVESKGKLGFGTSIPRANMKFGDFVDKIEKGTSNLYLSTQYETNEEDEENVLKDYCSAPLTELLDDFPLRPTLLGNLFVQNTNIWFGHSPSGTSSGLHHDFHDNLYILIRGRKKFTIFSPNDAYKLYTHGKIDIVYPNGLISYVSDSIRSDGASVTEIAKYEILQANKELDKAMETNNEEKIAQAQEKLDIAHDKLWNLEMIGEEFQDDFSEGSMSGFSDDSFEAKPKSKKDIMPKPKIPEEPNSFSKIDIKSLHSRSSQFPKLSKACRYEFEISSGEMLFLPAGWFHEVVSYSNPSDERGHVAFNYWCSPSSLNNFDNPYIDNYWVDQWKDLTSQIQDLKKKKRDRQDQDQDESSQVKKRKS